MAAQLLGLDSGTSAIKAACLEADTGTLVGAAMSPPEPIELTVERPHPDWAEQDPEVWWQQSVLAARQLLAKPGVTPESIEAIGIGYQMHGLVLLDKNLQVLRPAILWCDSRAVEIGRAAFEALGEKYVLERYLNSPGNFTASKLAWVLENEPEIAGRIEHVMLPGDYLAYRLTGEIKTTVPGLSEGILWNFKAHEVAHKILAHYGITADWLPPVTDTFSIQGRLTEGAARELGLRPGIPVSYRAGDQPNNALSLNVFEPGELAATAGTSGVIYGVSALRQYDPLSRVNIFAHVNHTADDPRYGVLLCLNGAGIMNRWIRDQFDGGNYADMDRLAGKSPVGSNGLVFLPFGNGAERMLENQILGSSLHGLKAGVHSKGDIFRAVQEGIVFALRYGLEIMQQIGVEQSVVRAGHANMFKSAVFREAFACTTGATLELYNTDGAQGAARGAGLGANIFSDRQAAFAGLKIVDRSEPDREKMSRYNEAYQSWKAVLDNELRGLQLR